MVNQQNFYLLNDSIFKTMFKESEEFREMLNNIFVHFFDFNLKEFNITSEELLISDVEDIKNKVDLLLEVENENYLVNIEINNGNKDYYPNRNLIYVCKIVFSIFKKTSEYRKRL